MTTDYDEYLKAVLDEPAEAAQTIYPRRSMFRGLRRLVGGGIEGRFKTSNLLTVTADRVLIFPQQLARGTGLTLQPAVLDWPRADVRAAGVRRCHLGTDNLPGQGSDYVLVDLRRASETVQFEVHRKGHQKIIHALGVKLTGKWN